MTKSKIPSIDELFPILLSNIKRYIKLSPEEQSSLQRYFCLITVKKKEVLLRAGDVCRFDYFVINGCLRLYGVSAKGQEYTIGFSPESGWAADQASFRLKIPAKISIETLEECALLQITHIKMEKMLQEIPKLERFFRIKIENHSIMLEQRSFNQMSMNAQQRYLHFRKESPELERRLPLKYIASYLDMTPVFLSMLRGRMAKKTASSAKNV